MLLQPQKHAKNPQYTIASVECTALPHANATIWYIALLLCSEAPAPAPSIRLPLAMCGRYCCINTHHPYSNMSDINPYNGTLSKRIIWSEASLLLRIDCVMVYMLMALPSCAVT